MKPASASTSKPFPLSRAELARRLGISRAAVSQNMKGRLRAASYGGRLVDARHKVVLAYASERGVAEADLLSQTRNVLTHRHTSSAAPTARGRPAAQPARRSHFVSLAELCRLLGVADADDAPDCTIDLGSPRALELFAAHPFERDAAGEPLDAPAGFLAPAAAGDAFDLDHPSARAFFARLWGRVPADSDFDTTKEATNA